MNGTRNNAVPSLRRLFSDTLCTYGMTEHVSSVLIGLSGGADSTVLTFLMHEYAEENGLRLYAFHLHHGIRGAEADRDLRHVQSFCDALQIPLTAEYADIPALAKEHGEGLEACARRERHDRMERCRVRLGCDVIALAHNANDVLETMLFRLARGTSLRGMRGILPKSGHIIRPLCDATREDILRFAQDEGLSFVEDSTNNNTDYTRNYIRHEIVPRMCKVHSNAVRNAVRTAHALQREDAFLEDAASRTDGTHDPVLTARRAVSAYYETEGHTELSAEHIERLTALVQDGVTGQCLSLPGNLRAQKTPRGIVFLPEDRCEPVSFSLPVAEGFTVLPNGCALFVSRSPKDKKSDTNIYKYSIQGAINSAKIFGVIRVRSRMGRDTVRYGGMNRQAKKLIQSTPFPPSVRQAIPVVCDDDGVLWLPGFPACDRAADHPDLFFTLYCKGEREWII